MSTDPIDRALRWRIARLAAAVGGGLTLTTVAGIAIPGLAPVLALQMLLAPKLPGLRQGIALTLMVMLVTVMIHSAAVAFGDRAHFLIVILALLLSIGFLLQSRMPVPGLLFLITTALVPVWMAQTGPRGDLFLTIALAVPTALTIVWLIDALLPSDKLPKTAAAPPPGASPTPSPVDALLKGAIILPVQIFYIQTPSAFSLAGIVTLIIILTLPNRDVSLKVLFARILGNVIGGLAAAAAFTLIFTQWTTLMLFLLALLGALLLATRLVRHPEQTAVMTLALVNFTMLLGVAVSQQLGGQPVDLMSRVVDISLIAAYGVGASSLFRSGFSPTLPSLPASSRPESRA